jgi:tRNA A37 threonylcarbamoyltransferase TsaD
MSDYPDENLSKLEQENYKLRAEVGRLRAALEKIVEFNGHSQSCSWFCDKAKTCDCGIMIAKAAQREVDAGIAEKYDCPTTPEYKVAYEIARRIRDGKGE